MPKHVHLVVGRHEQPVEQVVAHLKGRATRHLRAEKLHPFEEHADAKGAVPSCWAVSFWSAYLDDEAGFVRSIRYVQENPIRDGLRPQRWPFVTAWDAPQMEALRGVKRTRPEGPALNNPPV